ncbi:MAG: transcriptional repressor LexA [Desulfobacterales bacterium]|jgi:repressor LexA|nr:transcriptional repressor LexA [Desulfobacterales bacterium]
MPSRLTPTQQRLLDYLRSKIAADGRAPSLREAAADLHVSHAAVARTLKALASKGCVRREGRYGRTVHLLNRAREVAALQRGRDVPIVGRIAAGLPMYAQAQWDGSVTLDAGIFRAQNLFALRVRGDSMQAAGILDGDLVICEPRQYARNGEIVAALIRGEEATVKRFFLRTDHIELRPENPAHAPMRFGFGEVLVQGKVIGVLRVLPP